MKVSCFERLCAVIAVLAAPLWSAPKVTFYRDILPILQNNCQGCHRQGEAGPMPLVSYRDVQPFATAIKDAVTSKRMPPWQADTHFGKFSNERNLGADDLKTIVAWVDKGAPEGSAQDAPEPRKFAESWKIGKPDVVLTSPPSAVAAASDELTYCVIPTGFTEDRWIERAELLPANRAVLRDAIAFIREPGSSWLKGAKPGESFPPGEHAPVRGSGFGGDVVAQYAPGLPPTVFHPGQARLIPAGSDIVLQMHYTADNPAPVQASLGLVFAPRPPRERVYAIAASRRDFVIPAGAANQEVESKLLVSRDVRIMSLTPYMHVRGKSFTYKAAYPDGRMETLLSVPRYDFRRQTTYQEAEPPVLPAGSEIRCTAIFDNSEHNSNNPDANVAVRYGEQLGEEMMIGFLEVAFDANVDLATLVQAPK